MATLIDTSVWIDVFRDTSGGTASRIRSLVADDDVVLTRFNQLELLQGAADEREWAMLADFLTVRTTLKPVVTLGGTRHASISTCAGGDGRFAVRLDCCVAQLAIENDLRLLHEDRDFETIAEIRPLVAWRIGAREG